MQAEQSIRDGQMAWARSKGLSFDSRGYVYEVEANLLKPLSAHARAAFGRGAGSELQSHMKALHSSSALVANFFDYWTDRDKAPLLSALGIDAHDVQSLDFEARFPTGLGGTPPHLDVAITLESGAVIGLESKFTEYLSRSTKGKSSFELAYFPSSGGLWVSKGLSQSRANFSLWYLYYDCRGERSEAHKKEIQTFANRVGEEIRFKALTYQEVYAQLEASNQADSEYLHYLRTRYFRELYRKINKSA